MALPALTLHLRSLVMLAGIVRHLVGSAEEVTLAINDDGCRGEVAMGESAVGDEASLVESVTLPSPPKLYQGLWVTAHHFFHAVRLEFLQALKPFSSRFPVHIYKTLCCCGPACKTCRQSINLTSTWMHKFPAQASLLRQRSGDYPSFFESASDWIKLWARPVTNRVFGARDGAKQRVRCRLYVEPLAQVKHKTQTIKESSKWRHTYFPQINAQLAPRCARDKYTSFGEHGAYAEEAWATLADCMVPRLAPDALASAHTNARWTCTHPVHVVLCHPPVSPHRCGLGIPRPVAAGASPRGACGCVPSPHASVLWVCLTGGCRCRLIVCRDKEGVYAWSAAAEQKDSEE
ncbi:hypothetical protein C8J57DRAFT_1475972 [Mycena rebaudengoi]|nr:hypothetical protein C8J57DRAFT_1475972 [Mycena rebaudengoi]